MPRTLTSNEQAVLAHVVHDPTAWWTHASATLGDKAEDALAAKVARWSGQYDAAVAQPDYKTRAVREAEAEAARAALLGG